jgi:uncharacterized membrane protein
MTEEIKETKLLSQWLLVPIAITIALVSVLVPNAAYYIGSSALSVFFALILTPNRDITERGLIFRIILICVIVESLNEIGHGNNPFDDSNLSLCFFSQLAISLVLSYSIVRVM